MRERFQDYLGRFLSRNWLGRSKETPPPYGTYKAKVSLDEQLAETNNFIGQHILLLNEIFYELEWPLFRLAFTSVNLQPEYPYPFSDDQKSPWQTPDQQLKTEKDLLRRLYNLDDTDDVLTNAYLDAIVDCGKTTARIHKMHSEKPEEEKEEEEKEIKAYLTEFYQKTFNFIKITLDIPERQENYSKSQLGTSATSLWDVQGDSFKAEDLK